MDILRSFYTDFFTAGSLIPAIFCFYLAFFFLAFIEKKSRPTFYVGLACVFIALFNFGFFIAGGFYHPLAAYHRWLTVGVILFAEANFNMFLYHLNRDHAGRFGKVLLGLLYTVAVIVSLVFYVKTFGSAKVFHFDGHYWDFDADGISKIVGIFVFMYILVAIGLMVWNLATMRGRDRWMALSLGLLYLAASLVPSIANILSRAGQLDRETFQVTWDLVSIFGFLFLAVLYINYTKDRTTFMAKIVGVCLVTILVVMQALSFTSFRDLESAYDEIHRDRARLAVETGYRSPDTVYVMRYVPGKPGEAVYLRGGAGDAGLAEAMARAGSFAHEGARGYRSFAGRHFTAYLHRQIATGTAYEVGFSYARYRQFMHDSTKTNILILLVVIVTLLFGFRFFFLGALINPLRRLLEGLREVQKGNLDTSVAVTVEDEIGVLTHNFNQMVFTIRKARRQLDDYAGSLEQMVEERTAALQQASDALWGEMQLAKKIQTVLLPEKPSMKRYEIVGYMQPADEVGGDYYDIINEKEIDWVFIGDVSGHGVAAGIIMMMAQTSIRSILVGNTLINPSLLLNVANRTISYNVNKMKEDKYMTITAFAFHHDGRVTYSGLHQDILVYRAETGSVEAIQTDGMWLGLSIDLGRHIADNEFRLGLGDVVLLYTDGITEARGGDGEMFGQERLMEVFRDLGTKSPVAIRDGIIETLGNYRNNDDVTMVILKCVE